jgi:hypothetical protein
LAVQADVAVEPSLRTTAVDWMKLKLNTAVIAAAAAPHARAFKLLFIKVFMIVSLPCRLAIRPMRIALVCPMVPHRHGVIYNYITR